MVFCVVLARDTIEQLVMSLPGVCPRCPLGAIWWKLSTVTSAAFHPQRANPWEKTPSSPSRMITVAFENFQDFAYPETTLETNLVLLVTISMLLHMVQAFLRVKKQSVATKTPPTHTVPTQTSVTGQQVATTQSLFLRELQDIHKYSSCCPDDCTTTRLLHCWVMGLMDWNQKVGITF